MGLLRSLILLAVLHVGLILGIICYEMYHLTAAHFRHPAAAEDPSKTMRAAQFEEFGNASVVKLAQVPRPRCCLSGQILVRVGTGSLNPVDFKQRRMPAPAMMRPLPSVSGFDLSGVVEAVGAGVSDFEVGDAVFGLLPLLGQRWGAFQEFAVADASVFAKTPKAVPAREAAGLPLAGLTVLHALAPVLSAWQTKGETTKGKKILVQAGSGGVGTFAIQYCKHVLEMHVATTTSAANSELVKELGADLVIDYRSQDFEDVVKDYDVVLDSVTQVYESRTLGSKVLKGGGAGHYCHIISTDWQRSSKESNPIMVMLPFVKKWHYGLFARVGLGVHYHCNPVSADGPGLARIAAWVDQGLIKPVVDRSFPLEKTSEAHSYLEGGRARGKVLIEVGSITE